MLRRPTMIVACLNFLGIGAVTSVIGPALPALAHQTGSNLSALGGIISALFVGALISQVIGGPLNDHLGARPLLLAGLVLAALGLVGIAFSASLPLTLACGVLLGIGHGTIDIGTSVLIAVTFSQNSVVALNLVNVFFGIGAVAGPALAGLSLARWGVVTPALLTIAFFTVALIPAIATLALPKVAAHATHAEVVRPQLYRAPQLWLLAAVFLFYVGLENGIGGWIAVYIQHTTALSLEFGALVASIFWLALTGGRIVTTAFGGRLTPRRVLLSGVICALGGTLLLVVGASVPALTVLAVALIGLGFGPVFPTALAITTATFATSPGRAAGVTIAAGSIGGIIIPWLQGLILIRIGTAWSAGFVLAGAAALLVFALLASAPHHTISQPTSRTTADAIVGG